MDAQGCEARSFLIELKQLLGSWDKRKNVNGELTTTVQDWSREVEDLRNKGDGFKAL